MAMARWKLGTEESSRLRVLQRVAANHASRSMLRAHLRALRQLVAECGASRRVHEAHAAASSSGVGGGGGAPPRWRRFHSICPVWCAQCVLFLGPWASLHFAAPAVRRLAAAVRANVSVEYPSSGASVGGGAVQTRGSRVPGCRLLHGRQL